MSSPPTPVTPVAPPPAPPPVPPPVSQPGEPKPSGLPRRIGVLLAVIPVLAVGLADAVIAVRSSAPAKPAAHANPSAQPSIDTQARTRALRDAAIRDLVDRRAAAVLDHNRAAFLATVDPAQPSLVAQQRRVYDALSVVPFAQWSYDVDTSGGLPPTPSSLRYGVPTWAPQHFTLHYEISGFDTQPTSLDQYPTFVHRPQGWFFASFNDFASIGDRSDVDIWDYGALRVARAPGVLVIGHPQSQSLMHNIAEQMSAAIPRVNAVWGKQWALRVVVLVPTTQRELGRLVNDTGDLSQIAAVASAEVQDCPGPPDPVGGRVAINPANWAKLSSLGQRVVLTHELTHVATRADTGSCTPTWLVEGLADYVGYLGTGVPVPVVAQELAADVRTGHLPTRLPPDAEFAGSSRRLSQAYEGAWLACRLIVERWKQATLVRFYRAVGTSNESPQQAVNTAMRTVLHTTLAKFIVAWRAYLRAQLS